MRYFVSFLLLSIVFSCSFAGCSNVSIDVSPTENPIIIEPTASPTPKNYDFDNLTVDVLPTQIATLGDWMNNSQILLLSQILEEKIYLYGLSKNSGNNDGVILRVDDCLFTFDWKYYTPRLILPTLYYSDFDNDGTKEIAVILYVGSGTGISMEELHILEKIDNTWKDNVLSEEYYMNKLRAELSFIYDELNQNITICSKNNQLKFNAETNSNGCGKVIGLSLGDISNFSYANGKLSCAFGVGLDYGKFGAPVFPCEVVADITYTDGEFIINPFTLKE